LAAILRRSSASSVIPVTVVFLPGVLALATPPFFTDLLADFWADPALGVALVLGVALFFAETALGVFFADALGVFLADELLGVPLAALGVAALEAVGDCSSRWRLLDF
jgi:Na+-transporting methylmalonyl-CoA/oxaloacetate decarboxylase beta subunit